MISGNSDSDIQLYTTQEAAELVTVATHTTDTRFDVDAEWVRIAVAGKTYTVRNRSGRQYTYHRPPLLDEGTGYIRRGKIYLLTPSGIDDLTRERRQQLSAQRAGRRPSRGRLKRVTRDE